MLMLFVGVKIISPNRSALHLSLNVNAKAKLCLTLRLITTKFRSLKLHNNRTVPFMVLFRAIFNQCLLYCVSNDSPNALFGRRDASNIKLSPLTSHICSYTIFSIDLWFLQVLLRY